MSGIITAYDVYKMYIGLKMHFNTDYDYIKYNGKVKITREAFEKRKDKMYFFKLAKQKDIFNYLLSNYVYGDCSWIGNLVTDESENVYINWLKYKESLMYNMQLEASKIQDNFKYEVVCKDGQWPPLLHKLQRSVVSYEFINVLNNTVRVFDYWDTKIKEDILWPSIKKKAIKYNRFLTYDKLKAKNIVSQLLI